MTTFGGFLINSRHVLFLYGDQLTTNPDSAFCSLSLALHSDYAKVHDQGRRLLPRREKNHNFFFKDSIFTNDVLYDIQNTTEKEYVSIVGQKQIWGCLWGVKMLKNA